VQQLGEVVGRGQSAVVHRALNLITGAVVAVKRIPLASKSEADVSQLSTAVEVLRGCEHPSLVRCEGQIRTEHHVNLILECAQYLLVMCVLTLVQIRR
jgi:serine/threonine protein kinase